MKNLLKLSVFFYIIFANSALASDSLSIKVTNALESALMPIVSFFAFLILGGDYQFFGKTYQMDIFGFPPIVVWLIAAGVFFTFRLNFVNIRLFKHGINVVTGKYQDNSHESEGKISPAQSLFTAISATVGVGNIAGVAIAISLGGPGAVIWMMIAAFFGMSTKFTEVTLGQKYRKFSDGHLCAGAFYYLEDGLKEQGIAKLGKFLGKMAAICCILGALGGGIMFQANQSVSVVVDSFGFGGLVKVAISLSLAFTIGFILLGGIVRIAHIAEKIVPFMAVIYVLMCISVLVVNFTDIPAAVQIMFKSAFSDNALYGGIIGAIIQGFKRSAFSNEAGLGSAPIAHAAAKVSHPMDEGSVAILEPFIDTIIICFLSGLVITITGVYAQDIGDGVLMSKGAFETVTPWFAYLLSMVVFLFAFSTMLTYSYYGEQAWNYLSKRKYLKICHIIFSTFIFIGGMIKIGTVIDLADILFLSMAIPNIIGLYIMSPIIKKELDAYIKSIKSKQEK